jgi:hypothetical protein
MTSASPSLPAAAPKRRKFGTYSFVLAGLAFAVFTAVFGVYTNVSKAASQTVQNAADWMAIAGFLVVVPLMNLSGIVVGVAALFRSGDRKILGLVGAVLNLLWLIGGVGLGIIMIAHLGGR